MTDDQPRCGTCRYFDRHTDVSGHPLGDGLCRASLPISNGGRAMWCSVDPDNDWCAHFKPL